MLCKTEVLDPYYMGITALVTIAQQLFFFVIAAYFQFDKASDSGIFSPPMDGGDCQMFFGVDKEVHRMHEAMGIRT
jgi:hypothetical protein